MTWEPGRDRIEHLLASGELERVTPDLAVARRLITDATKHLDTATSGMDSGDMSGAYQLAYGCWARAVTRQPAESVNGTGLTG